MSDIQKYVPLKTIVSYAIDETNHGIDKFDQAWVLAFRALVKIGFNISFEPKTVRLPVDANQTVQLPSDYIVWTKIGVLNANNEISPIKINNSLTKWKDTNPNMQSYLTPDVGVINQLGFAGYPFFANYWYNGSYTPLFGVGNGLIQYGECVVDEKNKVIILAPGFGFQDLMVEFLSSPQKDNDYQIEIVCQEAVIAFIKWKMKLASRDEFYAELIEARRQLKPIRLQDINESIRSTNGMKLKA